MQQRRQQASRTPAAAATQVHDQDPQHLGTGEYEVRSTATTAGKATTTIAGKARSTTTIAGSGQDEVNHHDSGQEVNHHDSGKGEVDHYDSGQGDNSSKRTMTRRRQRRTAT
ncbi:hypothetical protein EDB89DRAFT_1901070 [Lactarius sanguifluus]|nr:hypothetical protein EDB89DRAFT_1901070 [Lactarius sanguifluus]